MSTCRWQRIEIVDSIDYLMIGKEKQKSQHFVWNWGAETEQVPPVNAAPSVSPLRPTVVIVFAAVGEGHGNWNNFYISSSYVKTISNLKTRIARNDSILSWQQTGFFTTKSPMFKYAKYWKQWPYFRVSITIACSGNWNSMNHRWNVWFAIRTVMDILSQVTYTIFIMVS